MKMTTTIVAMMMLAAVSAEAPVDAPNDAPSDSPSEQDEEVALACVNDAVCRSAGDSSATCTNSRCTCSSGFTTHTINNFAVQVCYNENGATDALDVEFQVGLYFAGGDFAALDLVGQTSLANAMVAYFGAPLRLQYTQGPGSSIIASAAGVIKLSEAEKLKESSLIAAASQATGIATGRGAVVLDGAWGNSVTASTGGAESECSSNVAGADRTLLVTTGATATCVVTRCSVTGYSLYPVSGVCVPVRSEEGDDDLSSGQIAGIVIGCVLGAFLVIGVVLYFVMGGSKSSNSENEPTADTTV